jgi:alkylation response protein AidB-like acyl-CoA dehydrogenase
VILDEELAAAGAPPRPSLGYLVTGLGHHASPELCRRFLPGLINGTERWCQGFSEPGAGSDLASLTTTAVRDGDDYVINGHKIWTSYSDVADWCLLLARTDPDAPRHKGISAFVISMHQPGIEQRPLAMISGVSTEFGQVLFDSARVPAANMAGAAGEGWKLAMTVVSHEREPSTLGFTARYGKMVKKLAATVASSGGPAPAELAAADYPLPAKGGRPRGVPSVPPELIWAHVQTQMLYAHVRRRLSEQLPARGASIPGTLEIDGSRGSLDKLLMTWTEQAVGHAALAVAGTDDADALEAYLYSRAQSVMGGTSQIQKNIIAGRILGLSV